MSDSAVDRRDFMVALGGTVGVAWLAAYHSELRAATESGGLALSEQTFEFFTPQQAREFDAITAQIVPTDETPGAREAHVVTFVDRYLASIGKSEQPRFLTDLQQIGDAVALRMPGTRSFAALNDLDQIACLTAFEQSNRPAFNRFRQATLRGMFCHPMHGGNANKVGWKLIGFEDRHSWAPPFGYYDRD